MRRYNRKMITQAKKFDKNRTYCVKCKKFRDSNKLKDNNNICTGCNLKIKIIKKGVKNEYKYF